MKPDKMIVGLGIVVALMMLVMIWDYVYFRHAGARFTAADGQALCLRMQALDGQACEYNRKQ